MSLKLRVGALAALYTEEEQLEAKIREARGLRVNASYLDPIDGEARGLHDYLPGEISETEVDIALREILVSILDKKLQKVRESIAEIGDPIDKIEAYTAKQVVPPVAEKKPDLQGDKRI